MRLLLWGRLAAPFILLWPFLLHAHGARSDVRVDLVPVAVTGLNVELHQDYVAPQLVLGNTTGKTLEILDAQGRAFLRIGPKITEADVAAAAYHLSLDGSGQIKRNMLSETPRWRQVRKEASYGWFDPRIATGALEVPPALRQLGDELPFGDWRIAARLDGKPLEITGVFVYTPPPSGQVQTRLESTLLAEGVSVSAGSGPTPLLFLNNTSRDPVTVLDEQDRPFLKIGPEGVWVDSASAFWRKANGDLAAQGWKKLSSQPSHGWADTRAAYRGKPGGKHPPGKLNVWSLPLLIGARRVELRGTHVWVPMQK